MIARSLTLALFVAVPLRAQNYEVRLKKAWVVAFADRTSMDATMDVRWAHENPNSAAKDGDMHFSGVSPDVGFPFVAEVVNARLPGQQAAVAAIKQHQHSNGVLAITGAWRLWFEHPSARQTQGSKTDPFDPDDTNPDHSFEIHPVSRVGQLDLGGSFIPVAGYTPQTADVAFRYYDGKRVTIKGAKTSISIRSQLVYYNYVDFRIELATEPTPVQDGFVVDARVLNANNEEVANGLRRMIFVQGTRVAERIRNASAGDRLHVLGIPRISLNKVLTLVQNHGTTRFDAPLPYEMIIVGVF
jgi:hypothetical protein